MEFLTTKVILQHLPLDKQRELLSALLEKDNELQHVYLITYDESFPTGGDWCLHSTILLITGNYKEAKDYYDKNAKIYLDNTIPESSRCPLVHSFYFDHGSTQLESVTFDFGNLTVHRVHDCNDTNTYPNYQLQYPMYLLKFKENYDEEYYNGPYQNYDDALIRYVNKISKMKKGPTGWSKDKLYLIEINLEKDTRTTLRKIIMCNKKEGMKENEQNNVFVLEEPVI